MGQQTYVTSSNISGKKGWQKFLFIVSAVAVIIVGGKYAAHYIFKIIAETGLRELFTATALLMVVSIAVAMDAVGLSPALGTFLAGVVLANSEFKHVSKLIK